MAARLDRGLAAHRAGRLPEAAALYRGVLAEAPDQADALYLLATIHLVAASPSLAEAISLLRRAVAAQPGFARAHHGLGEALTASGDTVAAIAAYRAALAAQPGLADTSFALGRLLFARHDFAAAAACFQAVLTVRPNDSGALNNLAAARHMQGDGDGAVAAYRRALALQPGVAELHSNLGCALLTLNDWEGAAASHRRALEVRPDDAAVLVNLGATLAHTDPEEAIRCYRRVIARQPDHADAHYGLSGVLLREGRLGEGWAEMAWWDRTAHGRAERARIGGPHPAAADWDGSSGGEALLVYAQQGLGDTLQFARFLPLAAARRPLVVQAPRSLHRLLASLDAPTRPTPIRLVAPGDALPPHALACPLPGLPHRLGITLETLAARVPYLHADPTATSRWAERLAALPGRRVGLVWAGSPLLGGRGSPMQADRRRSLALAQLAPLADVPGISFVSLQKGAAAGQTPPPGLALHDWTGELTDLADTAALAQGLDLVICVDTAVAHLAGALGRPVWLLNRWDSDWRWLRGRDDSPWYPTLRQFRQPRPGDWRTPLLAVRAALAEAAVSPAPPPG